MMGMVHHARHDLGERIHFKMTVEDGGAAVAVLEPRSPRTVGWLTADEATVYLGLPSRRALYMAIRRGQVPVHRLGRRMRFDAREIDEALRGRGSR
jgi:excisionase family DNA binding protein